MVRVTISLALAAMSVGSMAFARSKAVDAAPGGCSTEMKVEVDRTSLRNPDLSESALEDFRTSAGKAFGAAANALCSSGKLRPDTLHSFRRLLVQSGSGAVNTAVYSDPERLGKDTLVFQWIFDEENLAMPEQGDIEEGLLCWADPAADPCLDRFP